MLSPLRLFWKARQWACQCDMLTVCQTGRWALLCVLFEVTYAVRHTQMIMCTHCSLWSPYGQFTCTYRLFHRKEGENASRDKPRALISDYVTVKRTGRGCRRRLSTLSFILHSYWLLSLSVRRHLHINKMPDGSTVQSKKWAALHQICLKTWWIFSWASAQTFLNMLGLLQICVRV